MASHPLLEISGDKSEEGELIGKDPRKVLPSDLAPYHGPISAQKAIRKFCVDCSGGSPSEANKCTAIGCPLWPFRCGVSPWRKRLTPEEGRQRTAHLRRAGSQPKSATHKPNDPVEVEASALAKKGAQR